MNLTTIRTALAALVEANVTPYDSARPLRAYPVMPRGTTWKPPIFYLVREPILFNRTSETDTRWIHLTGRLLVGSVTIKDLEKVQAELDYYLGTNDAGSIYSALMLDNNLGGAAQAVLVDQWAGLESIDQNTETWVGDEITLRVAAR